jgi:hypothetical protein
MHFQSAAHIAVEEVGHDLQSFFGFGQLKVIPESMRQRFEDNELGIVSSGQKSAVQNGGVAEQ